MHLKQCAYQKAFDRGKRNKLEDPYGNSRSRN